MDRIDLILERMEVLASWEVEHEYFINQVCGCVELLPDKKTIQLLKRRNVKFKRLNTNTWALLGKWSTEWDTEDEVVLEVILKDSFFAYYTVGEWKDKLQWRPGMQNNMALRYQAKSLKWEYILLLKEWRENCQLELKEMSGMLVFEPKGEVQMNGLKGFRMVSTIAVPLCEQYDYVVQLSEKKALGNKILHKRLPWPEPGRFPECGEGCMRGVMVI